MDGRRWLGLRRWCRWAILIALSGALLVLLQAGFFGASLRLTKRTSIDNAARQAILHADSLIIFDDQGGMNPREKHYTLTRRGDQFAGEAVFVVRGATYGDKHTSETHLLIHEDVIQRFLEMLLDGRFEEGDYPPIPTFTDYYKTRSITLSSGGQTFRFFTTSLEGNDWILAFDESRFKTSSPDSALVILRSHLKPEVYQQLKQTAEQAWQNPTPSGINTPSAPAPTSLQPTATGR